MQRQLLLLTLAIAIPFAGTALAASADIEKVNGSITVKGDQPAGDVSTVNGGIQLDAGATAQKVSTVNGSIRIGERATIASIDTVNGAIDLDAGARVSGNVEAVNGGVRLDKGAEIGGRASNVNGLFTVDAGHIGGGIETVSGDIDVGADSRIEGGIVVDKQHGLSWGKTRNPRVVIGPRAVVDGTLEFRRPVDLFVSDSARVGTITGATATRFAGDRP